MFPVELHSLVENKTKVMGNVELADTIKALAQSCIKQRKDLYQAQEEIKSALIKDFGLEWFEKSGEAVNFIIENEYAHYERLSLPAFDMAQYRKDLKLGVMY